MTQVAGDEPGFYRQPNHSSEIFSFYEQERREQERNNRRYNSDRNIEMYIERELDRLRSDFDCSFRSQAKVIKKLETEIYNLTERFDSQEYYSEAS